MLYGNFCIAVLDIACRSHIPRRRHSAKQSPPELRISSFINQML